MGRPVARLADLCTRLSGHHCYPPRPNNQASDNVFVNSRGAHRLYDSWFKHCCKKCHSSITCQGSSTVFVNGRGLARVSDRVCCTSFIMTGSSDVFARTDNMTEIKRFSDINLSFIPHPLTGNLTPKTNRESIKQSLRVLFMLNKSDIPFNSSDLINVDKYLFEDLNHIVASNIVTRIEWVIKTYEKRIEFISAQVIPFPSGDGIDITVSYKVKALNIEDVFNQQFQKVR